MGRCIVYSGIRLLLLIPPFISSFFFLSNFHKSKSFVTLFSGIVRTRRLKHVTHMDNGQMYTGIRLLLYICTTFSFFFLSNFQTLEFFVTFFSGIVRPRRLKLRTHVNSVYRNQAAGLICPFIFFIFLSNFQTLKIFVTLFSGTMRPWRLKLSTHLDSGQIYGVQWNQAAAAYSALYFFFFLSLQLSNIKIFHHTFLRNCEALKVET